MIGSIVDPAGIAQDVLQAISNHSLGRAVNFLAQPNSGLGQAQPDPGMVPSQLVFKPSYPFYHSQSREAPPVPRAPTYPPAHQLTPICPASQPATLGSNLWPSSAQADAKYLFLEDQVKTM
ncbi:hypothetical protein AMTR_s00001p00132340 [Amborella trichopoda]|uniref:Uncharacterized protein n=1 Tax=Amborella trichopoda TaxID=13333 RepID=W1NL85_AMBTC|nr:hypothetical protein AMTR_s00001p00132340 [Amborella trichopoda]